MHKRKHQATNPHQAEERKCLLEPHDATVHFRSLRAFCASRVPGGRADTCRLCFAQDRTGRLLHKAAFVRSTSPKTSVPEWP
eukprot:11125174-Alexandrium_andersonii.AAC.1